MSTVQMVKMQICKKKTLLAVVGLVALLTILSQMTTIGPRLYNAVDHQPGAYLEATVRTVGTFSESLHQTTSKCSQKKTPTNIVFIKVHKSGSTTVANILARYALMHDLNVALPDRKPGTGKYNYFAAGIPKKGVKPVAQGQNYHVLFNHMIYNRTALDVVMPKGTFYCAIMRKPDSRFLSAVNYYSSILPKPVQEYMIGVANRSFSDVKFGGASGVNSSTTNATVSLQRNAKDLESQNLSYADAADMIQQLGSQTAEKINGTVVNPLQSGDTVSEDTKPAKKGDASTKTKTGGKPWSEIKRRVARAPSAHDTLRSTLASNSSGTSSKETKQIDLRTLVMQTSFRKVFEIPEIYNSLAYDTGMPLEEMLDFAAVHRHISKLDRELDLMLVMEHFYESLVLLKRRACLALKDILHFQLNSRAKKQLGITKSDLDFLHQWQIADQLLYDYFYGKFLEEVEKEGEAFTKEVGHLKNVMKDVQKFCGTYLKDIDVLVVAQSPWNEEFTLNAYDCKLLKMAELDFQKMLLRRADRRYNVTSSV